MEREDELRNTRATPPDATCRGQCAKSTDQLTNGRSSTTGEDEQKVRPAVASVIVRVVAAPFGKRPFRVHIDPSQDGAEVAFAVMDRVRAETLHRVGLPDLLTPRTQG